MSSRLKKWAYRSFLTLAVLAVTLGLVVASVLGTERGTRWALGQVSTFAPLEIETRGVTGTLLTDLAVPSVRYADPDRVITIRDVVINIDWSRTSLTTIALRQLTVRELDYQNSGERPAEREPLNVAMPSLPIGIRVDSVWLAALIFDDIVLDDLAARAVDVHGQEIAADFAAAKMDALAIEVNDIAAELAGNVPIDSIIVWRIAGSSWSGRAMVSGNLKKLIVSHDLAGDYPVHTEGTVQLLHRTEPLVDLYSEFSEWRYGEWTLRDGAVSLTGIARDYRSEISVSAEGVDPLAARINGNVAGDTRGLRELDINIETPIAHARATGSVAWAPHLAIDVLLQSDNLDPSMFVPVAAGAIDSQLRLTATGTENFTVDILSLNGIWNEQPADGRGRLSRNATVWQCADCLFNVGANRIIFDGRLTGDLLAGDIDIRAPSLHQLWPTIAGSLAGAGRVSGSLALPRLSGTLSGTRLRFAEFRIGSLDVQSSGSTLENIDVEVAFAGIASGETALGSGRLNLSGDPSSVDLTAQWQLDDFAANTVIKLTLDDASVDGRVHSASLTEPYSGTWTTDGPVDFQFSAGLLKVERGTWLNGDARLSHERISVADDLISVKAALVNGPVSALNLILPEQVRIEGLADASGNITQRDGAWSGDIEWQQRGTLVRFRSDGHDEYSLSMPVARATLQLQENGIELQAEVNADPGIDAALDASISGLSGDAVLDAQLRLNGDNLDWISILFPEIDNIDGTVTADIRGSGKLSEPDLSGELRWQNGQLAVPRLNLPLHGIDITFTGTSAGDMTIAGDALSGDGSLSVDGRLDNITSGSPSFTVQLLGNQADLLNWPDYQLTASPDLTIDGDTKGVNVTGRVDLDRAEIAIRELPEGAISPSDDVMVEGRESVETTRLRTSGDVEIELSDDIHLKAFGLDTNLEGHLRFVVPDKGEPQATGELRLVGGVFEVYGQRLVIERGTMLFTGPLDDPIINVRATRKIESVDGTVTAGIDLTGRAQNLSSTVFSDPSMSEADALSYLVLGRALQDATAADGSALSNTAFSMGLKQAALITNQIGQTVGLDELAVSGNNQNTTELVAGKQINSKMYVRYAYGVFTRLGHLLLRYRLSESFTIEVGAGETQSMDILYTIKKE